MLAFLLLLRRKEMYKIEEKSFVDLEAAMAHAKLLDQFVTIQGPDFEVCGRFGVDTVANGRCPDGVAYDWNKASRIGRPRRR
jgi:hypothetical protein